MLLSEKQVRMNSALKNFTDLIDQGILTLPDDLEPASSQTRVVFPSAIIRNNKVIPLSYDDRMGVFSVRTEKGGF